MTLTICTILGSNRVGSNTGKVLQLAEREFAGAPGIAVDRIDPRTIDLRLPGSSDSAEVSKRLAADLQARVRQAAGVLLVTPEYDGSYSAVLKATLEHLGYPSVLAGKPVAIIGVASGSIGADRAVEHLRSLCTHVGAFVVPGGLSLAQVHRLFAKDAPDECVDAATEASVRGVARGLLHYAELLGSTAIKASAV